MPPKTRSITTSRDDASSNVATPRGEDIAKIQQVMGPHHVDNDNHRSRTIPGLWKFDGSNFRSWRQRILFGLRSHGLRDITVGEYPKPEDSIEEATKWEAMDVAAVGLIIAYITDEVLYGVTEEAELDSAHQIWQNLEEMYQDHSIETIIKQTREVTNFRMQQGDNVRSHANRLLKLKKDLHESNIDLPEIFYAAILLSSMPTKYDVVCKTMRNAPEDMTIRNVTSRLLAEESSHMTSRPQASSRNLDQAHGVFPVKRTPPKPNLVCAYCKIPNHHISECRSRQRDEFRASSTRRQRQIPPTRQQKNSVHHVKAIPEDQFSEGYASEEANVTVTHPTRQIQVSILVS
jgi:gag-polypeptide of LTR copia-type